MIDINQTLTFDQERQSGIGGSDAAGVCRMSPYENKCPLAIYQQKLGLSSPIKDNEAMRMGREFEAPLLKMYSEDVDELDPNPGLIRHPKYPFLMAHLDGYIANDRIVEIKFINRPVYDDWKKPSEDAKLGDCPLPIYYQGMHYLMVTRLPRFDLYAYIAGRGIHHYVFYRDSSFILKMRTAEVEFWTKYVETKTPPPPMTKYEVKLLYPQPIKEGYSTASDEVCKAVNQWRKTNEEVKELNEKLEEQKNSVCWAIGEYEGLQDVDGNPLVSFKANVKGVRSLKLIKSNKG